MRKYCSNLKRDYLIWNKRHSKKLIWFWVAVFVLEIRNIYFMDPFTIIQRYVTITITITIKIIIIIVAIIIAIIIIQYWANITI